MWMLPPYLRQQSRWGSSQESRAAERSCIDKIAIIPMTSGVFEAKELKHCNIFLQIVYCPIQAELISEYLTFFFFSLT